MVTPLTDQSLVVHLFTATTGPRAALSYQRLREVWAMCAPDLGMAHPVAATGLPDTLPEELQDLPETGGLAARRSRDGLSQAILLRHHELLCLSVALSPDAAGDGSWREWDRRWTYVAGATQEWAVGEARLFVAYRGADDAAPANSGAVEEAVRSGLSSADPMTRLGPGVEVVHPPVTVWEVAGISETRRQRRFAAVAADRGNEPREVERWLWSQGSALAPFTRYLANAAKVRYEIWVHAAHDNAQGSAVGTTVDAALATLDGPQTGDDTVPDVRSHGLAVWRNRLLALIAGSAGLTQWITRLREMRTTVQIAEVNMRALRDDAGVSAASPGVFADDLALTGWFVQRVADELIYLEADRERARDALAAVTAEAEDTLQRRRELTQRQADALHQRQSATNLLQAAFLGAVLMVLAAAQTFDYRIPLLPRPAVPALIALLGALALLLGSMVLWLVTPAQMPVHRRGRVGAMFAGLVGAAGGWLSVTVLTHAATGSASPVALTLAVAVPAFGCGWFAMRRRLCAEGLI
ncbi:BN6_48550 family protein [Streptomyces sp. NBC_01167]|uniref:CATRA conflict system CASPASE/TPR repeat-associated protein n=1 Tax=Streptomyces sp. NBC_01167 TaxID=2903756 RepID=UPI00386E42F0|nr:BN6_48550 family protein [Streptomyces sp. NBC_01167]